MKLQNLPTRSLSVLGIVPDTRCRFVQCRDTQWCQEIIAQNSTSVSVKVFAYPSVVFCPQGVWTQCTDFKLSFLLDDSSLAHVCPDDKILVQIRHSLER